MIRRKHFLAAAAIMATSAVGPGFLTQTTVFTEKLLYNFGFVILLSIIIDIVAQVTIWKALTFSSTPVQKLADELLKGLGPFFIIFVAFGGLVFNIGNLAGTGMGVNAMFGVSQNIGTTISAVLVGVLFYTDNFLPKLDVFMKVMALVMVSLLVAMMFMVDIDFLKAIKFTFVPQIIDVKATITLVGGTVGGYITFAGAQRLLDSGVTGQECQKEVERSAFTGILFTGFFRYFLFIGVLSVVLAGTVLMADNPTASVFSSYFGVWGQKLFGVMIWCASITSVVGATYTSLAFLKDFNLRLVSHKKLSALVFIAISLLVYLLFGRPVSLLIFAGYLNAFVLPLGLTIVLISLRTNDTLKKLRISPILELAAWVMVVLLLYFSIVSLF